MDMSLLSIDFTFLVNGMHLHRYMWYYLPNNENDTKNHYSWYIVFYQSLFEAKGHFRVHATRFWEIHFFVVFKYAPLSIPCLLYFLCNGHFWTSTSEITNLHLSTYFSIGSLAWWFGLCEEPTCKGACCKVAFCIIQADFAGAVSSRSKPFISIKRKTYGENKVVPRFCICVLPCME